MLWKSAQWLAGRRGVTIVKGNQRTAARLSSHELVPTPNNTVKRRRHADEATTSMASLLAHAGVVTSQPNAPMSPPLHLASTYTRPPEGPYHDNDTIYSRMDNPTRVLLEQTISKLECHGGGNGDATQSSSTESCECCAFASGMAGISAIFMAHTSPLTVLLPLDLYHGVPTVLVDVMQPFGISYQHVDMNNVSAAKKAIAEASISSDVIVWLETPSNPLCHVIDIAAISEASQQIRESLTNNKHVITTVVDSTLSPPCLTQPLRLGADAVLHSGTKYLGGHSDVLLGVVSTSPWTERGRQLGPRLRNVQANMGAVASPFDSWLTLRGLRTLDVRLERQCQNAYQLAQFLSSHPHVTKVHYPGLESHPQHDIAKRQMSKGLYGGIMSIELETEALAMATAGALTLAQRATSIGGTETLVEHRASIEPPERVTSPPGLLRVSVGLEDINDLIKDFDRAIEIATLGLKHS